MAQPAIVQSTIAAHKAGYLTAGGVESIIIPLQPSITAPVGLVDLETFTHIFTRP